MADYRTTRRVPFTPRQMYDLVLDVEAYPQFVPLCEALVVRERTISENGQTTLVARMTAGYGAITESFTCRVTGTPNDQRVDVAYIEGPFRYLENTWTFKAIDEGCLVDFQIAYEFRSPLLAMLVGAMFDRAFKKFAEAFETRAHSVYGANAKSAPYARHNT